MKYDVIIVGGGPAGLMAALTAAQSGLSTILFEAKRDVTRVDRACSQVFYTRKLTPSGEPGSGSGRGPLSHDGETLIIGFNQAKIDEALAAE